MRLRYRQCRGLALTTALVVASAAHAFAQQPTFAPDRPSGIYAVGERVGWTVSLPTGERPTTTYTYRVRKNGGEQLAAGSFSLASGRARVETSLPEPGMLIVEVKPSGDTTGFGNASTGGPGRVLLGAAVSPTSIGAAEPKRADFDAFWDAKLKQLAAVPMKPVVKVGESGKPGVHYETVTLDHFEGSRVYGQLARPARDGKFPAMVLFLWANGPFPFQKEWITGHAAQGWLTLNVEPHDVPGDMPQAFYDALPQIIKRYNTIGQSSREESYFLRMYLGAHRAVEYLATRPDWNGQTIVVTGTSMGGQQSFAAAGLNPRVTHLVVHVPAGADVAATLHGRQPSYPNWEVSRPEVLATARYFDTINLGSRITARSLVSMGFIDDVSAPAGIWAVFNQIRGPKEAVPMMDAPHNHIATRQQQQPWVTRSSAWFDALVEGRQPAMQQGRP